MARKKISEFTRVVPNSGDRILIEQNGAGKSAALSSLPVSDLTMEALNDVRKEVAKIYKFKGAVTHKTDLPTTGIVAGDAYNVSSEGKTYAYNGSSWIAIGVDTVTDEVLQAREGYDGTIYSDLRTAIRTQVSSLKASQDQVAQELKGDLQTLDDLSTQQSVDILDLSNKVSSKIDEAYVEDGELVLKADGTEIARLTGFGGGGGGGGGTVTSSVLTVTNTSGFISTNIPYGESCVLSFSWSSTLDGIETGNGTMTVKVNSATKILSKDIAQGEVSLDVKDFLEENRGNRVEILVTDLYGTQRKLTFTIKTISMFLKSAFNDAMIQNGTISFLYTPVGEGSKEMHITIDGTEVLTKTSTSNNRQEIVSLPAQEHGAHTIEAWFTATLNGEGIESNRLKYTVICVETGNTTPVIALKLYDTEFKQYYTYDVKYQVWTPAQLTSVTLNDGDSVVELSDVNSSEHIWSIRKDVLGSYTLSVTVGSVTVSKGITVVESGIAIHPATEGLDLYLTSKGHVVGSPLEWSYNDISCVFTGFNGASDGWKYDKDNIPVMRLNGDARITIPFQPFGKEVSILGKTLEFEFATSDVFDYDTVVIDCLSGGRGIQATAQAVTLYSSENTLYTQYKEDEHVRMSFVISASTDKTQGNIVYCYINGIMSGVFQYSTDLFRQTSPVDITIGSNECTTDLYNIRIYDRALTRYEIVDNWIADMQNGADLVANVEGNDIYENDVVTEEKLLKRGLPCFVIEGTLPTTKKGVPVSGRYTDPNDATKSFTYSDAKLGIQGTSSINYPRKNYKIFFENGLTMSNGLKVSTYAINGGIPVDTFTLKADYASSEGANNVELVRLYNDVVKYKTPQQKVDPKVRQGIDGFPIAVFHGSDFVGKYNFNNDKGTPEVYGFEEGDQSWEITGNGSKRQLFQAADFDTYAELKADLESRYPKDEAKVVITQLKEMMTWVASTDTQAEGVKGDTTAQEARLAKFKNEFDNYFDRDSTFFYYLFTEMFLMVDSRAKNAFPSLFLKDGKWCWLPYDMDTALGIDNSGRLVFSYNLEDIDKIGENTVYNGQESVIWTNLRKCFYKELEEYYKKTIRINDAFNFDSIEKRFEDHQSKWPVALWNEDAYYKYIDPLLQTGYTEGLPKLQGAKTQQRKWWLYNRFRYIDSKYNTGLAESSFITFRAYRNNNGDKSVFELTPYADIYLRVSFDSIDSAQTGSGKGGSVRARKNEKTTLTIEGIANPNDLVARIYSADQLADIGDLSGFLPAEIDLSMGIKLQSIKVGDASPGYENPKLVRLVLGNNSLLKSIDARNCTALNTPINASQCVSLREAYFENTLIPSLLIPNGAGIETLHLPASLVYLQLRNLSKLTDLQIAGYNNLQTVWIENPSTAVMNMVPGIITGLPVGANVRALGINMTVDTDTELIAFFEKLGTLRGLDADGNATLDKAAVSGTIHIDTLSYDDKVKYETLYPDFTIDAKHLMCRVRFYSEDGSTMLTDPVFVEFGAAVSYTGPVPDKTDTAQYNYTFAGWSQEKNSDGSNLYEGLNQVETNLDLYAAFRAQLCYYTIQFINASYSPATVLQSKSTAYGETPVYAGQTPIYNPSASDVEDWGEFIEWTPQIVPVVGDATYTAKFRSLASKTRKLLSRTIKTAESDIVTRIGHCVFRNCNALTSVSFPAVTSINRYAFFSCHKLTTMYIGTESDTVCTLYDRDAIPSSVTKIYVPFFLVDKYKTSTEWSSLADKITAYEEPVECISLSITADNVPWYATTTTVHVTATCKYNLEEVSQGDATKVFTWDITSDAFERNLEESQRNVMISFEFLGVSASTTIVQDKYMNLVGGTIFYIDNSADGVYEFYDINGELISDVAVGDKPYSYKVVTPGSKDKYYILHDELYNNLRWTYYKDGNYVYTRLGTGTAIGTGKSNTATVLAADDGAYAAANGYPTIWYKLQQTRDAFTEGNNDWFIPSKNEIVELRLAVSSGSITGGVIAGSSYEKSVFKSKDLWGSSEDSDASCWYWNYYNQNWIITGKSNTFSVFFVRAF